MTPTERLELLALCSGTGGLSAALFPPISFLMFLENNTH